MKYFKELQEGVYDPNIFKAFFLAGGPGSGKSYVVGNTTAMFGMRIVNSDDLFEKMIKSAGMTMKMNTPLGKQQEPKRDKLRDTAKRIHKLRKKNLFILPLKINTSISFTSNFKDRYRLSWYFRTITMWS